MAETRRTWAVESFEQGRSASEVAPMAGMHPESVRRWKRLVEAVRAVLEQGAQAHGFEADRWTLERAGVVVERVTGVESARASVWCLPTGRLGWSLQRPGRRAVERDEFQSAR